MKPAIKKLKTCAYSTDLVASAALFRQSEPHTNKLTCDHPEMKLNWNEKVCGPCTVYKNRNAELVVPPPQPPQPVPQPPAKVTTPAPLKKPSPVVTAPVVPPSVPAVPAKTADPQKTAPVPVSKPAARESEPIAPPAKVAPKAKAPVKVEEKKVSAGTKAKSPAKPTKTSREQSQKSTKGAIKPKKK